MGQRKGLAKGSMVIEKRPSLFKWIIFSAMITMTLVSSSIAIQASFGQKNQQTDRSQQVVDEIIAKLAKQDPEAARRLKRAFDSKSSKGMAVALLVKEKESGLQGIQEIANQFESALGSPLVQLLSQAVDSGLCPTLESKQEFIQSHGTMLAMANKSGFFADQIMADKMVQDHLARLSRAMKDPNSWAQVRNDPLALFFLDGIEDLVLRQYYVDNSEWLGETLAEFRLDKSGDFSGYVNNIMQEKIKDGSNQPIDGNPTKDDWIELISTARKYHPLSRQLAEHGGAEAFGLLLEHGDLIKACVTKGIPALESADVIYANASGLTDSKATCETTASWFVEIRDRRPAVWSAAKCQNFVLELDNAVPNYSEKLMAEYADDNVAALLVTTCSRYLEPAAHSIVKYGDIAIYSICKYGEFPEFEEGMLVADGFRVPAYMMIKGDAGIKTVANKFAIDKEFKANGDPAGNWGWASVPIIGGPTNVVRNWANGVENDWSEIGWAALDVADGALIVASFGSSTALTATRATAKIAAKQAALLAKTGSRQAAKVAAKSGARKSLLSTLGRTGKWAESMGRTALKAGQWTFRTGKYLVGGPIHYAQKVFKYAYIASKNIPQFMKRAIYMTYLTVSLTYRITEKSLPDLKEFVDDKGSEIYRDIGDRIERTVDLMSDAFKKLLPLGNSFAIGLFAYWLIPLLFGWLSYSAFPRNQQWIRVT